MSEHACAERETYTPLLHAAVDGALSPEERQVLLDHLEDCPACREAYQEALWVHRAFQEWEAAEPPADLTAAVMGRIRGERRRSRLRSLRRFAAAAACLGLILYGARLLPLFRADAPAPQSDTASMTQAEEEAPLSDSGEAGALQAPAPALRKAEPSGEEQILEGVITYFNHAPLSDPDAPEDSEALPAAVPPAVPTLSSSDPELLDWMSSNIARVGYSGADAINSTEATAWLITPQEYEALSAHIEEEGMEVEMDWGAAALTVSADNGEKRDETDPDMICVVYLQAEEPGETEEP